MLFDKAKLVKMDFIISGLLHVYEPEACLTDEMDLMAVQQSN